MYSTNGRRSAARRAGYRQLLAPVCTIALTFFITFNLNLHQSEQVRDIDVAINHRQTNCYRHNFPVCTAAPRRRGKMKGRPDAISRENKCRNSSSPDRQSRPMFVARSSKYRHPSRRQSFKLYDYTIVSTTALRRRWIS